MAKIPVRITDSTNSANTSGGVAHRSIAHFDEIAVIGSTVAAANVSGGVVPLGANEYAAMMISAIGQQPAAWFRADTGVTVTGLGASTWADQSGNGRDLLQSTDASRPPYLSYSGTKYLYLPGVAGNYASTPDSVPASITGDLEIVFRCSCDNWSAADLKVIDKLVTVGNYSYRTRFAGGAWLLDNSADGTAVVTRQVTLPVAITGNNRTVFWFKCNLDVDNGAGGNSANFYYASDSSSVPTSWSQISTTQTNAGTTSIFDGNTALTINTSTGVLAGKFYRAIIKSGIDGTTVVDFNPDLDGSDQAATITSSATGEVWTINKSASGLIANLVGSPWLMGNGTSHSMATGAFVLDQPCTIYSVGKDLTWTLNDYIADGAAKDSGALLQSATTPRFKVSAGSAIGENAGLAVGALGVRCAVINGASSLTQVNLGTPVTGDAGAAQMDGITIFSSGAVVTGWWNGMLKEHIVFPAAHDATQRARVIQYLAGRAGISL